ncbi:hypothetical protein COO60DRAFT_1490855 [Scenedesmus sp. NREL 46B-D3]|nr:hypothetical protein COO60DRAFT_1490855 [Scenedesmus sp. NREL 46B-D3]
MLQSWQPTPSKLTQKFEQQSCVPFASFCHGKANSKWGLSLPRPTRATVPSPTATAANTCSTQFLCFVLAATAAAAATQPSTQPGPPNTHPERTYDAHMLLTAIRQHRVLYLSNKRHTHTQESQARQKQDSSGVCITTPATAGHTSAPKVPSLWRVRQCDSF